MNISLCMIVKDEEMNLGKCLQSIHEYVDEIIIVDTGSSDKTIEIANEYTDKIYDFKWCEDFSKARNYSVEKADNNWVLILDADEIVTMFDKENLLKEVSDKPYSVGRVKRYNVFQEGTETKRYIERVNRFFDKRYFDYEGSIHEQIISKGNSAYKTVNITIELNHIGYMDEVIKKTNKLERNISLLKQALSVKPEDDYLHYQLGKSLYMAKNYVEACISFEKALELCNNYKYEYVEDLVETYGYSLIKCEEYNRALMIEKYTEYYKTSPDYRFLMGLIYMNNARFEEAVNSFNKAVGDVEGKVEGANSYLANYNIGVIYEVLGNKEETVKYYQLCKSYIRAEERLKEMGIKTDQDEKLKISLCMIVKNEEKYIRQCLDNALPLVDEAIIVDTGSTDETLNILRNEYKDSVQVMQHQWKHDFAEARNASIKNAKGDWILVLDADEKVVCSKGKLRDCLMDSPEDGHYITIYNIINADTVIKSSVMVRLFRNKNAEFVNKVHEEITIDGQIMNPSTLSYDIIKIIHYGYLAKNVKGGDFKGKNERNIKLIKKDLEKDPENGFNWYNLGVTYMAEEKYGKAIEAFVNSNKYDDQRMLYHDDLVLRLGECLYFEKSYNQLEDYLNNIKNDSEILKHAKLYYLYGELYNVKGQYNEAAYYLEKGLEIETNQDVKMAQISLSNYKLLIRIARLWAEAGEVNKAVMKYMEGIFDKRNKYGMGKDEFIKLLKDNNMTEVLNEFKRMYGESKGGNK